MRILACFLLCSMMGGVSEVLFIAGKNFIKGRLGRTARKLPDSSAPIRARARFVIASVPTIAPNAAGLESEQA
jgi:hypothetical protein